LDKGKVKTYKSHDDGKEYVTNLYKAGDFFGYIPLLKNSDHTESAIVLEDSKICKISKEDFISLLYKNKDVAEKFIGMLSGNIVEK